MKYVSLDLETTGIFNDCPEEWNLKNVLQISMVVEDTNNEKPLEELPHFTRFVKHNRVSGEPYALAMNAWIIGHTSGYSKDDPPYNSLQIDELVPFAQQFLQTHFPGESRDINVCGKNVAFDLGFLPKALKRRFRHRVLDVGQLWLEKDDEVIPNSATVVERALIAPEYHPNHDAYRDALFNIAAVRAKWNRTGWTG